ncbi:MAG: GNAT family N-acetyltransferase, partial [Chitinophagales bacterium]
KSYGFIDEQIPEISMAVKSGFRGKGIGTKLIERISEEYQRLGYSALSLSVDQLNPAKNLYERMGFNFFEENGTGVTMKKDLLK